MKKSLIVLFGCLLLVSCSRKNEKIINIAQLKNKRICVLTGSAGDVAARIFFPDAKFLDVITATDAALTVKTNKAEAFVHNKNILQNIVEKEPELRILEQPIAEVPLAVAIKKGNAKLLADINSAINKLKNDGTLDNMMQKWINSKYQIVPELPNFPTEGKNGVLKVGTCAKAEPQTFLYNNIITGFDIELALRIGEILRKKIEITDMNFESLVPALQSGKIDVAVSNFNVTEERKKFVNFSNAYLTNNIYVLVKK